MANEQQIIQQYSEAEKTAYLSVIASLASADREASAQEIEFLQQLAQTAGLSPQGTQQVVSAAQDSSNQSIQQNLDALRNSQLRFSLVTDLISFARADGNYAPNEEQMINKMASYLGVNQEQVQTLETAVDQAAAHPQEQPQSSGLFGGISDKLRQVGIPPGAAMTGLLTVLAPMVLSRVMGGNRSAAGYGGMGGMSSGMGGLGGALGGLLGGGGMGMGGMGGGMGGMLGQILGGANPGAPMGGLSRAGGGLGALMGVLGGLGGQPQMGSRTMGGGGLGGLMGGGLGSVLGGLLGGR